MLLADSSQIFSSGFFYFATEPHWDLSSRLSHRLGPSRTTAKDIASFDARFIWNEYIIRGLLDFRAKLSDGERADLDHCQFLVSGLPPCSVRSVIAADSGHPGLCRDPHDRTAGAAHERDPGGGDPQCNITTREEASWNTVQHPRCGRRWQHRQLRRGQYLLPRVERHGSSVKNRQRLCSARSSTASVISKSAVASLASRILYGQLEYSDIDTQCSGNSRVCRPSGNVSR